MTQGYTKGIPIDTDPTLAADSNVLVASQAATKSYVDAAIGQVVQGVQGAIQYNDGGLFAGDNNFLTSGGGVVSITGSLDVDNIKIDGSTISATSVDGHITVQPNNGGNVDIFPTAVGEEDFIRVNNVDYTKALRVNAFGTASAAEFILHRHSTALEPIMVTARSNSNADAHAAVTNSQALMSIYSTGWTTGTYSIFSQFKAMADSTGTISATSAPGRIELNTSANGSVVPALTFSIDSAGKTTVHRGSFDIQGTTPVVGILNDNTMVTATADTLATSLSVKTYVDNHPETPGGNPGAVQFNSAGTLGGDNNFTTNGTGTVQITGTLATTSTTSASALIPTGAGVPTNGIYLPAANTLGFATNSVEHMRVRADGQISFGGLGASSVSVYNQKPMTGGTTSIANYTVSTVQSDATTSGMGYRTVLSTQAATFTLANLIHYRADQATIGAGSTVTNQFGFNVENTLTGATNNYGFYSNIAAAAGRWNFYANGTAANYFAGATEVANTLTANSFIPSSATVPTNGMYLPATNYLAFSTNSNERLIIRNDGNLGIGGSRSIANLYNGKDITGGIAAYATYSRNTIQSDVTSSAFGYRTFLSTLASAFTLQSLIHYRADQETIGAGSTVTNQFGFNVENTLIGATNNYGFYSNLAAAAGRWNFYANGTAANYFSGETTIAATTGNAVVGSAALATTATSGFLWIPSCAGAPTGAPTAPYTNAGALVVDTTNNRLYVRVGATWRYAALT